MCVYLRIPFSVSRSHAKTRTTRSEAVSSAEVASSRGWK